MRLQPQGLGVVVGELSLVLGLVWCRRKTVHSVDGGRAVGDKGLPLAGNEVYSREY